MKRILSLAILLIMALGVSALATSTRVVTLGNTNGVLLDDYNIWLFPGRFHSYPNLAIAEFSSDTTNAFNQFGMHWQFNEKKPWTLGTYFSTGSPVYPVSVVDGSRIGIPYNYSLPANRRLDLFYGRPFGDLTFGFHFNFISSGRSSDNNADKTKSNFRVFGFGFGLTPAKGDWDLAAALSIGSWTYRNSAGNDITAPDGYLDFSATGRCFLKYNDKITFVPHADFAVGSHGEKVYALNQTWISDDHTTSSFGFTIGSGMNYTPAKNVLGVLDLGFSFRSTNDKHVTKPTSSGPANTTETKTTDFILPFWKIGLEADVFTWMDIRFGATSDWANVTVKDGPRYGAALNATYLGFGFHWNRLHVDAQTDPNLFLRGFNFISGGRTNMNILLTAMYQMY